jgi:hypothetical protein
MGRDKAAAGYSFKVKSAEVPTGGLDIAARANEAQRAAIAQCLKIQGVAAFRIEASASPWRRHGLQVAGTVFATVEQRCVVTLDPVSNDIVEPFEARFEPPAKVRRATAGTEISFDALETEDPPEQMVDGAADIGAVAVEFLALAIDPYPRKPGVALEQELPPDQDHSDGPGAFEILRKLK